MKRIFLVYLFALTALIFTACSGGGGGGSNAGNYDITFYDNNGNILYQETVASGTEIELREPPNKPGYNFDGWRLNDTATLFHPHDFYPVTADTFFIGKWTKPGVTEYTVTFYDGEDFLSGHTETVESGTSIPLPNLSDKADYIFNGWQENGNGLPKKGSYIVTADVKFYANWSFTGVTPGVVNITSAEQLAAINANSESLSKHYRLTGNINLAESAYASNWIPIGTDADPFTGIFDGNGKTISGLKINAPLNDYVGLFGRLYDGAEISDLTVELSADGIIGRRYAGGIAGYAGLTGSSGYVGDPVKIENSHIKTTGTGSINAPTAGGIVGYAHYHVWITGCSNVATIYSSSAAGGIAGIVADIASTYNRIDNSWNTGAVTVTADASADAYAGGIVGMNGGSSTNKISITNSYNTGAIIATTINREAYAGGIIGYGGGFGGDITGSHNTGLVEANGYMNTYVGGIIGKNVVDYNLRLNYNEGVVYAESASSAYAGGIAGALYASSTSNYNTGTVSAYTTSTDTIGSDSAYAGGIAGWGSATLSYNTGDVTATSTVRSVYAGGIAGIDYGTVTKSYNTGDVTATIENTSVLDVFVGGIVGCTYGTVSETYNTDDITAEVATSAGYVYAAGIAGFMSGSGTVLTKNAAANDYVTVSTTGSKRINRILGDRTSSAFSTTVEHNFAFSLMTSPSNTFTSSDLMYAGNDKDSNALTTQTTYSDSVSGNGDGGLGWGFGDDDDHPWKWEAFTGYDYPTLYWQTNSPQ
jgi:hypothetical protein